MESLFPGPLVGLFALVGAVLWLVCLAVQYCRGVSELVADRRERARWRSEYDREQEQGIATINAIHNWSDEVYP
jgi:hypothetical protein